MKKREQINKYLSSEKKIFETKFYKNIEKLNHLKNKFIFCLDFEMSFKLFIV